MSHLNLHNSILLLAPALLLCACGSTGDSSPAAAVVQDNAPAQVAAPAPAASPQATQPAAAALREFRDPLTGQTREPTAAELKALAATGNAASKVGTGTTAKDKEIVFPNGTVAVEETTMSEMKGCMQKDGRATVDHDCKSSTPATVTKP